MKALIIFLAFFTLSESGCPSTCSCDKSSVTCIEKKLDCVPNFGSLINTPIIIDISGNKINYIDIMDFSYEKSNETKEIYLNNSQVVDIHPEAFNEMINLQELYLNENLLNSISENIIEKHENMILLDISSNYFNGDLPKIRSKSLEVLTVANSKISNVPETSLENLPNLKFLLLQQNNIKYISPSTFQYFQNFYVSLAFNLWNCDCKTVDLFEYLLRHNFMDVAQPLQCLNENQTFVDITGKNDVLEEWKNNCKIIYSVEDEEIIEELKKSENQIYEKEQPYSLVKQESEIKVAEYEEDTVEITAIVCEENFKSSTFVLTLYILANMLISFFVGILISWYYFSDRKKKLDTSESTTVLMINEN